MTLQARMAEALSVLVGQPLWGASRALNMGMFWLGEPVRVPSRKGGEIEIGKYALHIHCPWRIVGPRSVIVGSDDRHYPDDEDADWEEFDPDELSRCDIRMDEWLQEHSGAPLKVQRVDVDPIGGFRLFLQHGFVLEAFPADSLRGEYSERWRLFQYPDPDGAHFVVTGYGVEGDTVAGDGV